MRFCATPLAGAFLVDIEPAADRRGFFARTWCAREFEAQGLGGTFVQASISRNEQRGTVRGMHLQLPPSREAKLVRCTQGSIYDVIVDLRPDSATYLEHVGVELSSRTCRGLYVPPQMAHGFQTLEDGAEVLYEMTDFHAPELGCGWRWDDPAFGIRWPISKSITILRRDAGYADFSDREYRERLRRGVPEEADSAAGIMTDVMDLFPGLRSMDGCRDAARRIWPLMERLYPICRSITGEGVRRTLSMLSELTPLTITEVASGTPVFDWEVPREWNVHEAWIADASGNKVVDFRDHSLHLMSYSMPVQRKMPLSELRQHLHSMPDHPDWIPYRTSYYRDDWGFCLAHRTLEALRDGQYEVHIDSSLTQGQLTYGECVVRGESEEEILVFTHICHPSLCNDNLTGIAVAATLAAQLEGASPRLTFRFVFAPGTIGSITWLARNESSVRRVRHGLVLGLLGDRGSLTYKRSRRGNAEIDHIAEYALPMVSGSSRFVDFHPTGTMSVSSVRPVLTCQWAG